MRASRCGAVRLWLGALVIATCWVSLPVAAQTTDVAMPPVLHEFAGRVEHARSELADITTAAAAAAKRTIEHPNALITAPYGKQASFAEEMMNRSGCLANCLDESARRKQATPHDVFLFSVRSWQFDGRRNMDELTQAKKRGWMVVLFASKAGLPEYVKALKVDYLIDNGARTGTEADAAMNAIANVLNAWLWVCEYTAAMTRSGKHPGILQSILEEGHEPHNDQINDLTNRHRQFDWDAPIAQGKLAKVYLERVDRLIRDLAGEKVQGQINVAATLIAKQLAKGGKVRATHATHILTQEMGRNAPIPIHEFNVIWRAKHAFPKNVGEHDLLIFFTFVGLNTPLEDYATPLRQTRAKFITCHLKDADASNNAPDAAAHIDASWALPDAAVPIPFPPGRMAPVSGLNQGLVYRMLIDAAAAKLRGSGS